MLKQQYVHVLRITVIAKHPMCYVCMLDSVNIFDALTYFLLFAITNLCF